MSGSVGGSGIALGYILRQSDFISGWWGNALKKPIPIVSIAFTLVTREKNKKEGIILAGT